MADFDQESMKLMEDAENALTSEKVLSKVIPWEALQSATIIQARDLELIKRYDKQPIETKISLLNQAGDDYAQLFLKMIIHIQKEETLRYVLTLLEEILQADESKANLFVRMKQINPSYPLEPFQRILNFTDEPDWYTVSKAGKILAILMVKSPEVSQEILQNIFRWITALLRSNKQQDVLTALSTAQILLRKDDFRISFYKEDGLKQLAGLLKTQPFSFQLLYQSLYCFWLLSYNEQIAAKFGSQEVIPKLVEIIKTISKEKVIRMCLATLRNLIDKEKNNESMIESGALKIIENFSQRKWGDEDMVADLQTILESLQKNMAVMSSFDMYKQELYSGDLEWTPVHKSEKFWRENALRFEENNCKPLGTLIGLLNSTKATVLAVACHDIGEFVRFHPRGRTLIQNLNGKEPVMKLMISHTDPDVQKQALLATQKLMVHNWEYLSR